jgi:hypothetical protein
MGGAVSIHPPAIVDVKMKSLLSDKNAMDLLYEEIAAKQPEQEGRINLKGCISVPELIHYFKVSEDPTFDGFCRSADIIKQAYKHITGKAKKKRKFDQITRKQFRLLLPTLFLYSHLWRIFEIADVSADDRRIFKHEYVAARPLIAAVDGVQFSAALTDEAWVLEFDKLDNKKKDGYITFKEFCEYCISNIITPEEYAELLEDNELLHTDDDVVESSAVIADEHVISTEVLSAEDPERNLSQQQVEEHTVTVKL